MILISKHVIEDCESVMKFCDLSGGAKEDKRLHLGQQDNAMITALMSTHDRC